MKCIMMKNLFLTILVLFVLLVFGCTVSRPDKQTENTKPADEKPVVKKTIKLATTTSCDNSGLLKYILPDFTAETGIEVDVIAVGTGKALQHGRDGDVDVVLVHAPQSELQYIRDGWATARYYICQNEFVIVGSESDPAGLKEAKTASEALKKILDSESTFISRGDNSGTHKREMSVWEAIGIEPSGDWYQSAGQGMGAVLTMANEQQAYTLTDTGTYYSMIDKINLPILFSGDTLLDNIYSVMPLNPEKHPDLKHAEAKQFIEWLTSSKTLEKIGTYEVNGHILFNVAVSPDYVENPLV